MGFLDKFKSFGQKIWGGIRQGAKWVADKGLKIGRKVVEVAKPIVETINSVLPNPITGAINTGLGIADKVINKAEKVSDDIKKKDYTGAIKNISSGLG